MSSKNIYKRPKSSECVIILIDFQEAFENKVADYIEILKNVEKLFKSAKILGIPIIATEQYPKGLGRTVTSLQPFLNTSPISKTEFSIFGCENFLKALKSLKRKYLIIVGIETHVCVYQSALDALNHGFSPIILSDCVSSRDFNHKKQALDRLARNGVEIMFFEMLIFELLEKADSAEFREILPVIK